MNNKEFARKLIKRCYNFSLEVIKLVDNFPNRRVFWTLGDQLLRCACSVGANIVEAQAACSTKDFINFLLYALKSANETRFWLGLLRDSNKVPAEVINPLLNEVTEISKILGSSTASLRGKKKPE
ncbi:four helix bundle protein [Patescibacteria group bacterium]|nr:four helix bundle protein [Patescibacteria group bacterium]